MTLHQNLKQQLQNNDPGDISFRFQTEEQQENESVLITPIVKINTN